MSRQDLTHAFPKSDIVKCDMIKGNEADFGNVDFELYTIFALPGSSGWQISPTRTTQLKTRLDAAVAMRVYSISAGRTLH